MGDIMTDRKLNITQELIEMADEREQELNQWAKEHPEEDAVLRQSMENGWERLQKEMARRRTFRWKLEHLVEKIIN